MTPWQAARQAEERRRAEEGILAADQRLAAAQLADWPQRLVGMNPFSLRPDGTPYDAAALAVTVAPQSGKGTGTLHEPPNPNRSPSPSPNPNPNPNPNQIIQAGSSWRGRSPAPPQAAT